MDIVFHGAAGEVTGSCHLVEAAGRRVLFECGMVQGDERADERNAAAFPFDAAAIDAVVLSHAHIDHTGRVPLLVKRGFAGPIFTHPATIDLASIMLADAANLAQMEAEQAKRHPLAGRKPSVPPYTQSDVNAAMKAMRPLAYAAPTGILPGLVLTLRDAGHILGSATVELAATERGTTRRIVFTGDLGPTRAAILRDPAPVPAADRVVMESTYGDRLHRSREGTVAELAGIFAAAHRGGGNVIVPAFAVGRTQELLYVLARHFDEWQLGDFRIFLDSPMAIRATAAYDRHGDLFDVEAGQRWAAQPRALRPPNLVFAADAGASRRINAIRGRAIVIAGSGMCTGGRIRHHLRHNLADPAAHIVIVGYQAMGTLGRRLVDGATAVRLFGAEVPVRARVHTVGGLSAHADRDGLSEWYGHIAGHPPVCLVHGEDPVRAVLADTLRAAWHCEVALPGPGTRVTV